LYDAFKVAYLGSFSGDPGVHFDCDRSWEVEEEPHSSILDGRAAGSIKTQKKSSRAVETRPGSSVTIHNLASRGSMIGSRSDSRSGTFSLGTFGNTNQGLGLRSRGSQGGKSTTSNHSFTNENGLNMNMTVSVTSTVYKKIYGDEKLCDVIHPGKKHVPLFVKFAQDAGFVVRLMGTGKEARYVVMHGDKRKEQPDSPIITPREQLRRQTLEDMLKAIQDRIDAIAARVAADENAEKEWKLLRKELKGKKWTIDRNGDIIVINPMDPEDMNPRIFSMKNIIAGDVFHPLRAPAIKQRKPKPINYKQVYKDNQQPSLINSIKLAAGVSLYDKGYVMDGDVYLAPQQKRRYQTPRTDQLVTMNMRKDALSLTTQELNEEEYDDDEDTVAVPKEIINAAVKIEKPKQLRQVDDAMVLMTKDPNWGSYNMSAGYIPPILPEVTHSRTNSQSSLHVDVKHNPRGFVDNPVPSVKNSKKKRQRHAIETHRRAPSDLDLVKSVMDATRHVPGSMYATSIDEVRSSKKGMERSASVETFGTARKSSEVHSLGKSASASFDTINSRDTFGSFDASSMYGSGHGSSSIQSVYRESSSSITSLGVPSSVSHTRTASMQASYRDPSDSVQSLGCYSAASENSIQSFGESSHAMSGTWSIESNYRNPSDSIQSIHSNADSVTSSAQSLVSNSNSIKSVVSDPVERTSKYLKHLPPRQIATMITTQMTNEAVEKVQTKFPKLSESLSRLKDVSSKESSPVSSKLMKMSKGKLDSSSKFSNTPISRSSITVDEEMVEMYLSPKSRKKVASDNSAKFTQMNGMVPCS
jgi:hypothetical protein